MFLSVIRRNLLFWWFWIKFYILQSFTVDAIANTQTQHKYTEHTYTHQDQSGYS